MSEITQIKNILQNTHELETITNIEETYSKIAQKQKEWYQVSNFYCPDTCGECCRNFEPDLFESEALYMAAWILENKKEYIEDLMNNIFPFPRAKGCQFWKEEGTYHCEIYGGRPAICRLFGASGSKNKNEEIVLKPCKFYPIEKLQLYKTPLYHKQYNEQEIKDIFGILPPVMSNSMEEVLSISPDNNQTKLIRDCLPDYLKKLIWIKNLNEKSI